MKTKLFVMFAVAMMCVSSVAFSGEGLESQERSGETSPYTDLREAVQKIRELHTIEPGKWVAVDMMNEMRRPRLGILLEGGARLDGETTDAGAVVAAVTPGGPADEAGLLPGDVIISFNGEPLAETSDESIVASALASRDLVERSKELESGETVVLTYLRDGVAHEAPVVAREMGLDTELVGRLAPGFKVKSGQWHQPFVARGSWFLPRGWLDMELVSLNPELGEYFGADSGVLVVRGPENDDSLGLLSGDVILRIGDREVKNPEHALRILRSYEPDEDLTVQIIRRGKSQTLTGTVPSSPFEFSAGGDLFHHE